VPASPDGRLAGYRLIRRIAEGDRADVFLAAAPRPAVAAESQTVAPALVVVRVYGVEADDAAIMRELEAMSTDASGALPRLHDVTTLPDGRCCVVVERLGGGSLARILASRALSPGEAVTILAPIVVAIDELARHGFVHTRLASSDVLFDDDGRPRLIGLGAVRHLPDGGAERTALRRLSHERLAELVEDVVASVVPSTALSGAVELVRSRLAERPFTPCEPELERLLFELASPEPVKHLDATIPARRVPARIGSSSPPVDQRGPSTAPAPVPGSGAVARWLALMQAPEGVVDQLAAAADIDRVSVVRGRLAALLRSRGRALTVGGLIGGAVLVLLLTLVPPATAGDELPVATSAPASDPSGTSEPDARATGPDPSDPSGLIAANTPAEGGPGAAPPDDPIAAARDLLARRASCFALLDLECLGSVAQPGSPIEASDRIALAAALDGGAALETAFDPATVELVAEMGGAVLVRARLDPEREPASLLMVRGEAGWRLREMFD